MRSPEFRYLVRVDEVRTQVELLDRILVLEAGLVRLGTEERRVRHVQTSPWAWSRRHALHPHASRRYFRALSARMPS